MAQKHSANLDMLRSLAVIGVFIDHLWMTLHHQLGLFDERQTHFFEALGAAGVAAFFVHTSLVLMNSLESMHREGGPVTLRFYVRRIFRIYPLAIVAIVVAVVFHVPSDTWHNVPPLTHSIIAANILLVQNLWTKVEVLGPLWSLPYEVEMYVLLPVLYLIAAGKHSLTYLSGLFAGCCLLGTLIFYKTGHMNMTAYFPCFIAGILCYALRRQQKPYLAAWLWAPFVTGLLISYLFMNFGEPLQPNFWSRWVFCLVLGLTLHLFFDCRNKVVNYLTAKIATFSYGIYLWHSVMLYVVFLLWHVRNAYAAVGLVVLLTWVASVLSFHAVESPFIRYGRTLTTRDVARQRDDDSELVPVP